MIRGELRQSLARLDEFVEVVAYLPLTTQAMRLAAEFWADARNRGRLAAPDLALDGDVILAAQARIFTDRESSVIVATTNVRHLADFVHARLWEDIPIEV